MATSKHETHDIVIKRVYEPVDSGDGFRVLVDRLWPRGMKKEAVHLDLWAKDVAPSTDLRNWFNHEESIFREFRQKYLAELAGKKDAVRELLTSTESQRITLLYAASNINVNHAIVLRDFLLGQGNR
ncbi:DUF488 domain-containing protein [Bythopirellula goksoeyrii]|uniref:DUF488 domain-containing protein n=1 Tax=Bythopirellula goksoeyrii TaxID=1400387 RepID=A0A5B9QH47_9BACT|nr:DUF488 family protein [Bythopirellula goksoeyrii]QEG36890.1 hypothetical protein Pr1d_42290 [Bythopirellula goksoeyrii]